MDSTTKKNSDVIPYTLTSQLLSVVIESEPETVCDPSFPEQHVLVNEFDGRESSKSQEEKFCRICLETNDPQELMSPCDCKGSLQFVHFQCLKESVMYLKQYRCGICKKKFSGLEVKVDQLRSCLRFAEKSKWLLIMLLILTCILTFQLSVCLLMLIRALEKEEKDYLQAVTSCFWMLFYAGFYAVFSFCCIRTQWRNRRQILVVVRSDSDA